MAHEKALITGCGGFIGSYLAEFLLEKNLNVYGMVYRNIRNIEHIKTKIKIVLVTIILKCYYLIKH